MPKTIQGYTGPTFPAGHPFEGESWRILNRDGDFTGSANAGSQEHTLTFCIPWEGLETFALYCLLYTSYSPGAGSTPGTISRNVPMQSPYNGFFPNCYAQSIQWAGGGQDDDVSNSRLYSDMIARVTFGTLTFDPGDGSQPYLTVSGSGSASYLTYKAEQSFAGNGEKIDHDAGVLVGQEELRFAFAQIPDIGAALSTCKPIKGQVNSDDITLDGVDYPAGSLLYNTHDYAHTVNALGSPTAQLTLSVTQRDIPWNSGIRSDGVVDAITPAPYQTTPFAPLLGIG